MAVTQTLRDLDFDEAMALWDEGAALIDLRTVDQYLDVHVPGSLCLGYEFGPGMASRARDCIPLHTPIVLLDLDHGDMLHAAASLRGKGFEVLGKTEDAVNRWVEGGGKPGTTDVVTGSKPPPGPVLDVADPGARVPKDAVRIPVEVLWDRASELGDEKRLVLAAGYGVRAALAVGMLEHAGVTEVVFWKSGGARRRKPFDAR